LRLNLEVRTKSKLNSNLSIAAITNLSHIQVDYMGIASIEQQNSHQNYAGGNRSCDNLAKLAIMRNNGDRLIID
jgi:hypothetical protein